MRFQKSQPAGAAKLVPLTASTGLLKIWMNHPPHEKRTLTKCKKKTGSISNTCKLLWPVRGDMKKRLSKKPV
jgi:hypothetical protein